MFMNNNIKILLIPLISLLVAFSNQIDKNIIIVNEEFNEKEKNIIRTLMQEGIIINLKNNRKYRF